MNKIIEIKEMLGFALQIIINIIANLVTDLMKWLACFFRPKKPKRTAHRKQTKIKHLEMRWVFRMKQVKKVIKSSQ